VKAPSAATFIALAVALLVGAPGSAGASAAELKLTDRSKVNPRLLQLDFTTPAIEGGTGVRVLLPPGYRTGDRRYPVLYLMHGAGYDERGWTVEGEAQEIVGSRKVIVVMPRGGGNGYYTDWFNGGDFGPPAYEELHVRQLVPWIDDHFRTRANRGGRAVAGFSMAGFGAMSYAARHPQAFAGAFSFSGAIDTNYPPFTPIGEASSTADGGEYAAIWGTRAAEEVRWRARNPWDLASNLRAMTLQIRTGNGQGGGDFGGPPLDPIEFGVHEMAISMDARLDALGIPHLLEDYGPGAHEFPYYSRSLRRSMPAIMETFRDPPKPPKRFTFRAVERRYAAWGYRVAFDRPVLEFSKLVGRRGGRRFSLAGSGTASVQTPATFRPGRRYRVRVLGTGDPIVSRQRASRAGRLQARVPLGEANEFQQYTPEAEAAGAEVRRARVRIRRLR